MTRILLVALFVATMTSAAFAERRVALVFSADHYQTLRPLENAGNDAIAVKAALEALDFQVFLETDRDLRRMRRALDDFRRDAMGADAALVYFSGHGVEIAGENRLLPIDANASTAATLEATSLPLEEVRETVADIGEVGMIILDACRNDPFGLSDEGGRGAAALGERFGEDVRPGLGRTGRAENILFAFSTAPGRTASDGAGENSPFTAALVKYLGTEGLEIRSALTLVQQEVYDATQGRQLPYVENGLPEMFFASTTREALSERERLLLAMADVTPDIRREIEHVAAERNMPLAPIYGALIAADAAGMSRVDRGQILGEAADAFVKVRDQIRGFASDDPRVTRLRREAGEQLSLGAFDAARATLGEAADIDSQSRRTLKANFIERTLSEATTRYLRGSAARTDLHYRFAIADYEKAVSLFDEVDGEDMPAADKSRQASVLRALGNTYVTLGDIPAADAAYTRFHRLSSERARGDPDNIAWQSDLSLSYEKTGDMHLARGDLEQALDAYRESLGIRTRIAERTPSFVKWGYDLPANAQSRLAAMHIKIGDVHMARNESQKALEAYQASLAIALWLTFRDLDNARWQFDLSANYERVGNTYVALEELPAALAAYKAGLGIMDRLATANSGRPQWQRGRWIMRTRIGDVHRALGDLPQALEIYRAGLDIAARSAREDPANARWRFDLIALHERIAKTGGDAKFHLSRALDLAREMKERGKLSRSAASIAKTLRRELGAVE